MHYFTWNSLCCLKETSLQKYAISLPRNYLSFIFEFQLLFPFSLILGDPFMVLPKYGKGGGGRLLPINAFHGGKNFVCKIYREIVLHGGLMIRSYPGQRSFTKFIF